MIDGGPSNGVLAWIGVILSVLAICKYVLGYRFTEFFKILMEEFRYLAHLDWNDKSLNALGICIVSVVILSSAFFTTAAKIFQSALNNGQSDSGLTILLGGSFLLSVFTIACLKIVSPK